jgi:hypothetical protein
MVQRNADGATMIPVGTGKIAALTEAASSIGQAACRRLLEAGWTVVGLDVMMFLLSGAVGYVTETTIPVGGGTQAAFIPPGSP